MRIEAKRIGFVAAAFAVVVVGCGGSIMGNNPGPGTGQGGQGGATTTLPCSAMGACECLHSDRCTPRSEACWCPGECYPGAAIDCICGGGRFLACEESAVVASCASELRSVQDKCANQSNLQWIAQICTTSTDVACVAACLSNLKTGGACSEIDCRFCPVCDCAVPSIVNPFASCIQACAPPPPERL